MQYEQEPDIPVNKVDGQMVLEGMKQYLLQYDEEQRQKAFEYDDFMNEPN